MKKWITITVLAAIGLPAAGFAQDGAPRLQLNPIARMQMQLTTSSVAGQPSTNFEMRRVRFGASATFNDWLGAEIESEYAMSRLQMRSMYVNMAFSDALELRFGQFKKPFSLMELNSEMIWPVIERGVRIRGLTTALLRDDSLAASPRVLSRLNGNVIPGEQYEILATQNYLSYDLGMMLHGTAGRIGYAVGVFNGEGSDRVDVNDAKSYAARVSYRPATTLPIALGAAVSHRETAGARGTAYEADLEIGGFRRDGLHFTAEVSMGDNFASGDDFFGAQGVLAFFRKIDHARVEGVEIAGRASYGDPGRDVADDEGLLLTPGFNVYFNGRNRLMLNWDVYQALGERLQGANALRLQAQFSL